MLSGWGLVVSEVTSRGVWSLPLEPSSQIKLFRVGYSTVVAAGCGGGYIRSQPNSSGILYNNPRNRAGYCISISEMSNGEYIAHIRTRKYDLASSYSPEFPDNPIT